MIKLNELWTPRWANSSLDLKRCRASVHDSVGWGFYQCSRKASVFRCVEDQDIGFCKQHDPEVVSARRAARNAAYDAKFAETAARYDRERKEKAAIAASREALRRIAEGHNDPRALAAETLALFPNPAKVTERLEERG